MTCSFEFIEAIYSIPNTRRGSWVIWISDVNNFYAIVILRGY